MPEFANPVAGNFCWTEVFLEDPARGKGFYGELFGWAAQEVPSPHGSYSMMNIGGKLVAGISRRPDEMKKTVAPASWLNHVFVTDATEAAEKAKSLGATILRGPMAVGPGTMVILEDPTGGQLALWSTKQSMGTFLWGEPNALCWNELVTTDAAAATKFYVGLFGWKAEPMSMGGVTYTVVKNGDLAIAGLMQQPKDMAGVPTAWTAYFAVNDCDATVKKAQKLGAAVFVPPQDIPDVGRFAILADPEGAVFAVMKEARAA
jgi:predicted enzyme related to lactoylglutathione lyase